MSFGKNVATFRKCLGFTQKKLAETAQINYRHYQDIEGDKVDLKLSSVLDLAKSMEIPPCFLLQQDLKKELLCAEIFCPVELIDQMPVGLLLLSSEGRILFCNKFLRQNLTPFSDLHFESGQFLWDLVWGANELVTKAKKRFQDVVKAEGSDSKPTLWNFRGPSGDAIDVLVSLVQSKSEKQAEPYYLATVTPFVFTSTERVN